MSDELKAARADAALALARANASDAKTKYNDLVQERSELLAQIDDLTMQIDGAQRDYAGARRRVVEIITAKYNDPEFPTRPWTHDELRYAFTSQETMLARAIALNRGVHDVKNAVEQLRATIAEQPEILATFIGLTRAELVAKIGIVAPEAIACDECHLIGVHQINCSRA